MEKRLEYRGLFQDLMPFWPTALTMRLLPLTSSHLSTQYSTQDHRQGSRENDSLFHSGKMRLEFSCLVLLLACLNAKAATTCGSYNTEGFINFIQRAACIMPRGLILILASLSFSQAHEALDAACHEHDNCYRTPRSKNPGGREFCDKQFCTHSYRRITE